MFPEIEISNLIFKEVTLLARKMENNLLWKDFLYFRKKNIVALGL